MPARHIEYIRVDQIVPAATNPKKHALDGIGDSMARFGYTEPVVMDERTGRLIAGHGRIESLAARHARGEAAPEGIEVDGDGGWMLPVVRGWASSSDAAAAAALVASNKLVEAGGWDEEMLAELLGDYRSDPDWLTGTGYGEEEVVEFLARLNPDEPVALGDPDDVPEAPAEPITKAGDLWNMGPHKLLCGDATKRDTLATLLGDERPDVLLTDPPYGVSHGSGITEAKAIRGDIGQAVIPVGFAVALEFVNDDARLYVFGGSDQSPMYHGLWDHHLSAHPKIIVWVKEMFVLRQNGYHSQYEFIYWGWKGKGGGPTFWFGDRTRSDVWTIARDAQADRVHSTQKPVDLFRIPVRCSAPPAGLVLDPFAGSGTTLMACHAEGRIARLVDNDEAYCDVILTRWQSVVGVVPILERTGEPHDFLTGEDTQPAP